jgi:uncharacterized protein
MTTALEVVQQFYEAFGRGDVTAVVNLVASEVDWEGIVPATLPYAGRRRTPQEVADFFAALERAAETAVFEPQEFIEAGENVTVLGWVKSTARDTRHTFESEWVHVFTVTGGKITRWRGFFNTAAHYGL